MAHEPIQSSISIPSSFLLNTNPAWLASPQERRWRRLLESGVQLDTCPDCGCHAVREEVVVRRPGDRAVRRVLLRCQGQEGEKKGCPVRLESEQAVDC